MLNNIVIMGRLTRDVETRVTQSAKKVASFSIACDRPTRAGANKETDFFDIVAWEKQADFVERFFKKGDVIIVSGRLQTSTYTDRNGATVKSAKIIAQSFDFANYTKAETQQTQASPISTELEDDGTLPF